MIEVKVGCYIERTLTSTEFINANRHIELADELKSANHISTCKMYSFIAADQKLIVSITEEDRVDLGLTSSIVGNFDLATYPLGNLHKSITRTYEIMVRADSELATDYETAVDMAQAQADQFLNEDPTKLPIVKLVDYKFNQPTILILPSVFNLIITEVSLPITDRSGDRGRGEELIVIPPDINTTISTLEPTLASSITNIIVDGIPLDTDQVTRVKQLLAAGMYNDKYVRVACRNRKTTFRQSIWVRDLHCFKQKIADLYANGVQSVSFKSTVLVGNPVGVGEDPARILHQIWNQDGTRTNVINLPLQRYDRYSKTKYSMVATGPNVSFRNYAKMDSAGGISADGYIHVNDVLMNYDLPVNGKLVTFSFS
jgi:hypothetical protein